MKPDLSMKTDKQRRMIDIMNDSRTPGHKISQGNNCSAATGNGSLVVGSPDGKIRLYPTTSSRQAKTAFPGFGSPITHVDVTRDGKWILGTTDTYLILLSALFIDKDGRMKSGFTDRMGKKIPAPTLLKLTPVHSRMTGVDKFYRGHFSNLTEDGKQECLVVTTVGKFRAMWNLEQVNNSGRHGCYKNQQGLRSCYCYKLVLKDDQSTTINRVRFIHHDKDRFASFGNSPQAPVQATPVNVTSLDMSVGGRRRRRSDMLLVVLLSSFLVFLVLIFLLQPGFPSGHLRWLIR